MGEPVDQPRVTITSVRFRDYKALHDFSLALRRTTILVGPNNSGKSTVIGAFRVLAAGLQTARSRNPVRLESPDGLRYGYKVPEEGIAISLENVHTDYADIDSTVTFRLSNGNSLQLYFPADGGCYLFPHTDLRTPHNTSEFRRAYPIQLTVVPVLGPLEHEEELVEEATVRRNLGTHRASRNFRNYWLYERDDFPAFQQLVAQTWPDTTIGPPEITTDTAAPRVIMWCREGRIPRELYWAGFGFQVWCQLLTHLVRAQQSSLVVIDEPEIYLHPDLQRQLVGLLHNMGPDVLAATHSSEILAEAEPPDLVVVDKRTRSGRRLRGPVDVTSALRSIGSNQNVVLTQLARTRRVLFVEGRDFYLLSRFARLLGLDKLANGSDFALVPLGGFPEQAAVAALCRGMRQALSLPVAFAGLFDRDYRPDDEVQEVTRRLRRLLRVVIILRRKELENYLLVPSVLERAIAGAIRDRDRDATPAAQGPAPVESLLLDVTDTFRYQVHSQLVARRTEFLRRSGTDSATVTETVTRAFDASWSDLAERISLVPGKAALAAFNTRLQRDYAVSLSVAAILREFKASDIPYDLAQTLQQLDTFRECEVPMSEASG